MSESTLQGQNRPRSLYPQLRARRNVSRTAVGAHQRARLYAAMIEACADRGYAATTVNEIVALAGVSKKTLYKHFESKEACFFSTYDLVVRQAMDRISAAYRGGAQGGGDWTEGLCRAFEAFVEELVERPKPSRLALVDVLAVAPAAERVERVEAIFGRMIAQSVAQGPDGVELPPWLLRSIVGGTWFVARNRVLEGHPEAVSDYGRELHEWIVSYCHPGVGSIGPDPRGSSRRGSPAPRGAADERTAMMLAAARIAADIGYAAVTPGQIVELARTGEDAFAAEFGSVRDCFLSSLQLLSAAALAQALRDSAGAPDWPSAVCRVGRSIFEQIACDRAFARAAFVEVFAAGPDGVDSRATLMRSFASLLERRAPPGRRPSPLVAEAIVGAVWSFAHRHVVRGRAPALASLWGRAALLVLAPVVGAEQALEAIGREHANLDSGQSPWVGAEPA